MFQTNFLQDDQSYLVADYDRFSLTVGILTFHKRVPKLEHCVRSFFPADRREFHPRLFEQHFSQCCEQLEKIIGKLPEEVCVFLDQSQSVVTSTGYTFTRENLDEPVHLEELDGYARQLLAQSENQSRRIWQEKNGYNPNDRKLISIFLSHLALDKRHHTYPLGKMASHVTLRCLFFYGNRGLVDGISRSISACGFSLLTCVPLSCVFLNHLCNRDSFLDNHLHIHLGYDSTTVILHLGKHIQEIRTLPFGWQMLYEKLTPYFSPLERESHLMNDDYAELSELPESMQYQDFLEASLRVLFEKFDLQWSFSDVSVSGQGPISFLSVLIKKGLLGPWIQKNATVKKIGVHPDDHWLHYWNTLDPLFTVHSHPLLSLVRSVFLSTHESH